MYSQNNEEEMGSDFSKEFFQRCWGDEGYYETFSYGVGIDEVCRICLDKFFDVNKEALEIGCGGGAFTERMINKFKHLTAIDVIKMPQKFNDYNNFNYVELPDKSYDCGYLKSDSIDFCFSYNVFCHLSNVALINYLKGVHRVLKARADFVFMIANFEHSKKLLSDTEVYNIGDKLPFGHFYQDETTVDIIADNSEWQVISRNMIPAHRDIIIHLKKK